MKTGNSNITIDIAILTIGLIIGATLFSVFNIVDNNMSPIIPANESNDFMSQNRFGRGATGFFVSDDGCIVTNAHAVDYLDMNGMRYARVFLPIDSTENYYFKYAEILKIGDANGGGLDGNVENDDLAVLKLNNNDPVLFRDENDNDVETDIEFTPIPLVFNINTPIAGESVFTIGHPNAIGEWIPMSGVFIAELNGGEQGILVEESNIDLNEYIFDLITFPGNSGGPILNMNGEVVSIVWGGFLDASLSELFDDEELDSNDFIYYWPIDNSNPDNNITIIRDIIYEFHYTDIEFYSELIITPANIGFYLDYVGYWSTFGETSTTIVDFLNDTPCNIKTSTANPINFYDPELDGIDLTKESLHIQDLVYNKTKYQVVAIDVSGLDVPEQLRSMNSSINNDYMTNIIIIIMSLIVYIGLIIYKRRR